MKVKDRRPDAEALAAPRAQGSVSSRLMRPLRLGLLVPLIVAAAARASSPPRVRIERWPEADVLFHRDERWRGADDAYSLALGQDRILWLFADTFVAENPPASRRHARMIRNSIGLQSGANPATARMQFTWGHERGQPASFFPDAGDAWFWPGDGVLLGRTLLLFLMKVRGTSTGLHFQVFDWAAVAIDNASAPPRDWHLRWLETPANPFQAIIGSGPVLRHGDYVYAYGSCEGTPRHDICLVRWPVSAAERGELAHPAWWVPEQHAWIPSAQLSRRPSAVMTDAQSEFTIHREPRVRRWLAVQTVGFGAAGIGCRWANELTGPWSEVVTVYRPPEATQPGVMIYAGKAHPELAADALAVTYVVNAGEQRVLDDESLYYPRFLRLRFGPEVVQNRSDP